MWPSPTTRRNPRLLLTGRRALNTALEAMGHHLKEDMCVPVRRLGELVSGGLAIGERLGVTVTMSGHGGDGNLHPMLFLDPADAGSVARATQAFDEMVDLTLRLGGTIAGEHGIGTLKEPWLARELGPTAMAWQHRVKSLFDPGGIMNPGKVLAPSRPKDW
jgi:glycolate dehydrogenase FAD-linked subunit